MKEMFVAMAPTVALVLLIGYLIGSVSFSIIITRAFQKDDIRKYGSGNAGATNVLRSVGKLPALLTFALDFLKCVVAVLAGYYIMRWTCTNNGFPADFAMIGKYAAGLGCLLGHIKPIYFGFKGGKGVVTACAMIALLDWRVWIAALTVFIIVFVAKRIVSLASVIGMACYPFLCFIVTLLFDWEHSPLPTGGDKPFMYIVAISLFALLLSIIIILVHIPNIKRLMKGEEKQISFKSKKEAEEAEI